MRAFRDAYAELAKDGAEVFGISSDSVESHAKFRADEKLPFRLLSDPDGKVRELYQVPDSFLGMVPGRVTFVLDAQGIVRDVYQSQLDFAGHAESACSAAGSIR